MGIKEEGPLRDRVWEAAAKHEAKAHKDIPNSGLGYHIEYAPLCLTCKACKVAIPVEHTEGK